ncbi:uncharacterized protein LOC122040556 [Zingiber officinale]|uniref:uncharacterized protein LOC122040556 n=1 Tax=Zingiber officinale TaxID=94328 RepID=UPI001C4B511B|nr:uncharacterized protein LOC122040556 [Zingiber officinale]
MEQVSRDMDWNEGILSLQKNKSRLKTPEQVQALEKVYNEQKYPSESLKLLLANQIGLSQKQVSRWFFHRRMKNKKLLEIEASAIGNQKNSSSLINDQHSGVEQESCSSSKQGDLHLNSKDVESKRSNVHQLSMVGLAMQQKTASGRVAHLVCSNSRPHGPRIKLKEMLIQERIPAATDVSKHLFMRENKDLLSRRSLQSQGVMLDSRQYNHMTWKESYAVSSLKLKLGKLYCHEGPSLGVHFDPLPPGAFSASFTNSTYELCHIRESMQKATCNQREHKQLFLHPNTLSNLQSNHQTHMDKPTRFYDNHNFHVKDAEDSERNRLESNCRKIVRCSKYRPKMAYGRRQHFYLNDQKASTSKAFTCLQNYYDPESLSQDFSNRESLRSANKNTLKKGNVVLPKKIIKSAKTLKERTEHPKLMTSKRKAIEFQSQGHAKLSRKLSCMDPRYGCSVVIEPSFNEDDDPETTSSID